VNFSAKREPTPLRNNSLLGPGRDKIGGQEIADEAPEQAGFAKTAFGISSALSIGTEPECPQQQQSASSARSYPPIGAWYGWVFVPVGEDRRNACSYQKDRAGRSR